MEPPLPRLRGLLHAWAFWFALAAAVTLIVVAPGARARVAAVIYGIGLCALFGASATYHRWRGNPRWKPILRRVDHAAIFVFIAATSTPIALLVLEPPLRTVVLVSTWTGAALGVAFTLAWLSAPRILAAGAYLAVGWVGVVAVPALLDRVGVAATVLFIAGGALYTLGAAVYATRRPDPWPSTFGFHEIFHVLVIAAAVAHYVAMAGWVVHY